MPELEQQLRAYGQLLEGATPEPVRSRPRRRTVVLLAAAAIVIIAIPLVLLLRDDSKRDTVVIAPAISTTTSPSVSPGLQPSQRLDVELASFQPLAVAAGDVWIAHTVAGVNRQTVRVDRRDPRTAAVLATIDVPQESVLSLAASGNFVWVAGGGDGGVPDTTVSKIDARTNRVVLTRTLDSPCACASAADADALWLGGNGSDYLLKIDAGTGRVVAHVNLAAQASAQASALAVVGDRLQVGLAGGVAVVDPAAARVERTLTIPGCGRVMAIAPTQSEPDSAVVCATGGLFKVVRNAEVSGPARMQFLPRATGWSSRGAVALGGDYLWIGGRTFVWNATRYDETSLSAFNQTTDFGDQFVVVDGVLWIARVYANGDASDNFVLAVPLTP